jgi:hypothetical protein
LRTLAQAGLVFSEGNGEEVDCSFLPPEAEHFNQVSQTLDEAAWATLEQLILIGMASHRQTSLLLPLATATSSKSFAKAMVALRHLLLATMAALMLLLATIAD